MTALAVALWAVGAVMFWHHNRALYDQRTEWAWSLLWPVLGPMVIHAERRGTT